MKCTPIWTVRLPRACSRIYHVTDDIYIAYYDSTGETCTIIITDTVEEYYRAHSDIAQCSEYKHTFYLYDARYHFSISHSALCVRKCDNLDTICSELSVAKTTVITIVRLSCGIVENI